MSIAVTPAGAAFAPVLAAMQRACFPDDPWSESFVASLLSQTGAFALIAAAEAEPAGFVLARVAGEDGEILALGTLPQARRAGVGRALAGAAVSGALDRGATAVFLEVAEDNDAARSLYARCGFVPVGRRPGYYRRGAGRVAALVLRCPYPSQNG